MPRHRRCRRRLRRRHHAAASRTTASRPPRSTAPRESTEVTRDGAKLAFYNSRAEGWWRLREALEPDQEGGSGIALPPDDELKADLASPHWELTARGIKLEPKDDIKRRIGRSPGKGDAVVMAWAEGAKAVKRALRGDRPIEVQGVGGYNPILGK